MRITILDATLLVISIVLQICTKAVYEGLRPFWVTFKNKLSKNSLKSQNTGCDKYKTCVFVVQDWHSLLWTFQLYERMLQNLHHSFAYTVSQCDVNPVGLTVGDSPKSGLQNKCSNSLSHFCKSRKGTSIHAKRKTLNHSVCFSVTSRPFVCVCVCMWGDLGGVLFF